MQKDPNGEWVRHSDVVDLETRLATAQERLKGLEEELKGRRAEIADLLPQMDADAMTITGLIRERGVALERAKKAERACDNLQRKVREAVKLLRVNHTHSPGWYAALALLKEVCDD